MAAGSGKCGHFCTHVREQANASGLVVNGALGSGFSIQAAAQRKLPDPLETIAAHIRRELAADRA